MEEGSGHILLVHDVSLAFSIFECVQMLSTDVLVPMEITPEVAATVSTVSDPTH